jgi:arylsulfatase A-like enzyme
MSRAAWPMAILAFLAPACSGGGPRRTNVILLVVDTLRADALAGARVPNIDRLAHDGLVFPLAFSHAPSTLPAHTALFSSRLPHQSGVLSNGDRVPEDLELFPAWLARQGWHTEAVTSIATLWPAQRGSGIDRGFGAWRTCPHEVAPASEVLAQLPALLDGEHRNGGLFLFTNFCEPHQPYDSHGTADVEAEVLLDAQLLQRIAIADSDWWQSDVQLAPGSHEITIRAEVPFQLRSFRFELAGRAVPTSYDHADLADQRKQVAITIENPTARPTQAKISLWIHDAPPFDEIARRYRLEVEAADTAIGAVLAELDRRGLYDSSLIVFTSDHGEELGERGSAGHVRDLYDELLHVPLIVKLPSGHPKARALATTKDELVRQIDLVPTVVDLLDLPVFRGATGVSLFEQTERLLLAETHPPAAPRHLVALRDARYKMVLDVATDRIAMFDLVEDPRETRDVFERCGGERPSWRETLHIAARTRSTVAELDPETQQRVRKVED